MQNDRIFSFSVKPENKSSIEQINKLKQYSKNTGISFSLLVIQAITLKNKELENDRRKTKGQSNS